MFRWVDQSAFFNRVLQRVSNLLARQRGLPVVIGLGLVIMSFVLQLVNVFSPSQILDLAGVITLYTGLLTALIGLLLAVPLGK